MGKARTELEVLCSSASRLKALGAPISLGLPTDYIAAATCAMYSAVANFAFTVRPSKVRL